MVEVLRLNTLPNTMLSTLEDVLERVKGGQITDMALTMVTRNGNVVSAVITQDNVIPLLGAVTDLRRCVEDEIER